MADYFLSAQALTDLTAINDYLFDRNPTAADAFLDEITQRFERLAQFPKMGRSRDELSFGLRSLPFQVYLILYRESEGGVEIARIVSGYRDLEALFSEESQD
ncbi:type II toxin-antitoxin system RelE/ParE family toxin [Microcoleus sp. FACHB-1515]|uniref:type II toxin-antitoxin system RelE/ParE family toxin n=1 Tax=Cyanophyceae TaxID=3028117 RepID=UPI00168929B3|nr:type II toxin-antitoxin system RelE/ParE family toxin [Microcoleus sp. FACHB-1515]MBD2090634.1 type II toxin-antitoxin system RelE/ParE family toxin [Microcoleus sp. FACHB-1515]